jgi:hypothetical protein
MGNPLKKWILRHGENDRKGPDLEDVAPEHPEAYPARHLKERLDGRRDAMDDIENGPKGMPEGPGGF